MGKNVRPELLITLGAHFQVLCDGLLLYGQTTAISKSRYYAWKIGMQDMMKSDSWSYMVVR